MKKDEKLTLWTDRIHEFQASGQSCKSWCQEHQIPVSTMGYWIRRLQNAEPQHESEMVFAKMPTKQEISARESFNRLSPIKIFIASNIRIEVMQECPSEFFNLLIEGLKDHA